MDAAFRTELTEWGMDWDEVLGRFMGNEAMIVKYTMKMLSDSSFDELKAAVTAEDGGAAFNAVHTLKGVCSNLGLSAIYEPASVLTEELRGGGFEKERVMPLFDEISERYTALIAILEKYRD